MKDIHLDITNTLPIVYKIANFLALRSRTGTYRAARVKHTIPIPMHKQNAMILCIRLWKKEKAQIHFCDGNIPKKTDKYNKMILTLQTKWHLNYPDVKYSRLDNDIASS